MTDRDLKFLGAVILAAHGLTLEDALIDSELLLRQIDAEVVLKARPRLTHDETLLRTILQESKGNVSMAARAIGCHRTTLIWNLKELGIRPADYRAKAAGV